MSDGDIPADMPRAALNEHDEEEEEQAALEGEFLLTRGEMLQIEQVRSLEGEHLLEEEEESLESDASDDDSMRGDGGAGPQGGFTFDPTITSMHTYLGDIDDVAGGRAFIEGGSILNLPMFYLEGIVLFPEQTLPLRVMQPRFKAAVQRAMAQSTGAHTIGVIHVSSSSRFPGIRVASMGTTAEIRQFRHLPDGSINVMTKGRQRFRLRRAWMEADGSPCAQVQIINEEAPLPLPRSAFAQLAAVPPPASGRERPAMATPESWESHGQRRASVSGRSVSSCQEGSGSEGEDEEDVEEDEESGLLEMVQTPGDSPQQEGAHRGEGGEGGVGDEARAPWWWWQRPEHREGGGNLMMMEGRRGRTEADGGTRLQGRRLGRLWARRREAEGEGGGASPGIGETGRRESGEGALGDGEQERAGSPAAALGEGVGRARKRGRDVWGGAGKAWAADEVRWKRRAQMSAWPHWVYRMYDAYDLARRVADMFRQTGAGPIATDLVRSPDRLAWSIASNLPIPDEARQELLELESTVRRLHREIHILESMDRLRCGACKVVIARRSDMMAMSTDGPISAFVNAHGHVHETLTLRRARGLVLEGPHETENSWFPGYAWTIAHCGSCGIHVGWRFTAGKRGLRPLAFWGVRRAQLAGDPVGRA